MTGPTARGAEREALAEALCWAIKRLSGPNMSAMCGGGCKDVADALLASGWLAAHDAAVAAQARREAAQDIAAAIDGMHDGCACVDRAAALARAAAPARRPDTQQGDGDG